MFLTFFDISCVHVCTMRKHGCQMAIARVLDHMCLALRDSGLWLLYATLLNLIPSFPWMAPPRPPPWRNPRKGGDQILPSGNLGTESNAVVVQTQGGDLRKGGASDARYAIVLDEPEARGEAAAAIAVASDVFRDEEEEEDFAVSHSDNRVK